MSEHRSTQTRYPWRAVARTMFAFVVGLAATWAAIVQAAGVDETAPIVASSLTIAGGVTRVLALPQVDDLLRRFFPWLAAEPK